MKPSLLSPAPGIPDDLSAALAGGLPAHQVLAVSAGDMQRQTDELDVSVNERVTATQEVRQARDLQLASLTGSDTAARALIKQAALTLPVSRVEALLGVLNVPEEERVAALRALDRIPLGAPDRPTGGPLLSATVLGLFALIVPLTGLPGWLTPVLLLIAAVILAAAYFQAKAKRARAEVLKTELLTRAETWQTKNAANTKEAEKHHQRVLASVTTGHDIPGRIAVMDATSSVLAAHAARPSPARIGLATLSEPGDLQAGLHRSPSALEAMAASRRLRAQPIALDLQPGTNTSLLMLGETDGAFRTLTRLAPQVLTGLNDPLYCIDFTNAGWGEQLNDASVSTRPVARKPNEIQDLLEELSARVRRNKLNQKNNRTDPERFLEYALLVVYGVPAGLTAGARSALYDLLQDGPSTGLSVLAAVNHNVIAQNRRWNDLEAQMLVLYPPDLLPEDTLRLREGQWWAAIAGRPVTVHLTDEDSVTPDTGEHSQR